MRKCFSKIAARPTFDPSCTSPCTGMIAGAGSNTASTPSMTAPPPIPKAAVMKELAKLTTITVKAIGHPSPA